MSNSITSSEWLRVTRDNPCPVCGKPDWCMVAPDGGAAICARIESDRPRGDAGWLHVLQPPAGGNGRRNGEGSAPPTDIIEAAKSALYSPRATAKRKQLASSLGVSAGSLKRLHVGWSGQAWTIPELDSAGSQARIIGICRRLSDGSKRMVAGSKRGLCYPLHWSTEGPLLIVEGASDVAAGLDLELPVVGRPSNTGGVELLAELLADWPAEREIVVMGEHDAKPDGSWPGRDGAQSVAQQLAEGLQRPVQWALPPDGAKDLRSWYREHGADSDALLERLERQTVEPGSSQSGDAPILRKVADVEPETLQWLWPGRIPLGKLTLLAGDPGLGKSLMSLDIAARVSAGRGFPDDPARREPGSVVLLSAEDDLGDTIRPRLDAAGANVSRIVALEAIQQNDPEGGKSIRRPISLQRDLHHLETAIERIGDCRLVVVDPISAYCGKADSHKDAEIRGMLAPLADLAARYGLAIVAVTHLRKGGAGKAIHRAMGSLAFSAAARAVWMMTKDGEDESRRLMLPAKCNLASDVSGLAYHIESDGEGRPIVVWSGDPVQMTADDAFDAEAEADSGAKSETDEAKDWLRDLLLEDDIPAKEAKKLAGQNGFSEKVIRRAKDALGVESRRIGFGRGSKVYWSLPDTIDAHRRPIDAIDAPSQNEGIYDKYGASMETGASMGEDSESECGEDADLF